MVPDKGTPGTVRGGGRETANGKEVELESPRASVAVIVMVNVPGAVAVPLSHPLAVIEKFGGSPEPEKV